MEIVKVSPSAYILRDPKSSLNVGCIVTPDGVVLIDTGCPAQDAAVVQERLREITDQPIAYVISTQAHGDLGLAFSGLDAPVIAHARRARGTELLPSPTVSFTEDGYLFMGGVLVELLHAPTHVEGSLAVHLPDEKVVFVSDVVAVDGYPIIHQGNAFRWHETLVRLKALNPARVVPSRGRVAGPEDIDRHIAHLQNLVATTDLFSSADAGVHSLERDDRVPHAQSKVAAAE